MFDRAQAQRPPTAWRADPTLFEGASVSDFAAWRIAPLQGELSDLSREALARFEAEQEASVASGDDAGSAAPAVEAFKPGLPSVVTHFVPDVHVPVGQTLRDNATEPSQAQDDAGPAPETSAELSRTDDAAASLDAEPPVSIEPVDAAESDRASAESSLLHPDEQDAPDAATSPDDQAEPQGSVDDLTTVPVAEDTVADATEADLAGEDVIAAEALAEVERERAESLAAQAQPSGIDPDEVARREAEQYQRGREDGERAAREALEQEVQAQRTVLATVAQDLHALLQNPTEFFEPLKRLALHLAEQITLTQWQSSTHTLEALIRRCLDTLDHATQGAVVVELHPLDLARLRQAAPELIRGMRLDANDALRVGSVRLYANDAVVEDLIEHRLSAIVRSLHLDAQAWQQRSLLLREHSEDALHDLVLPDAPLPPDDGPHSEVASPHDDPPVSEDDDVHP